MKKLWWSQDEELELRFSRKNSQVFKTLSAAFEGRLNQYSSEEIEMKMHNLRTKYRNETKTTGPYGGSQLEFAIVSKHRVWAAEKNKM